MSDGRLAGRVVLITGAAGGIGRAHALAFAREGAAVVVNDVGASLDGSETTGRAADATASEIRALGGTAVANGDDISRWDGARRAVAAAVEAFGDLHVVVNNAGILRDRMLVNMDEGEWDDVVRVHLKGTFATSRWAAAHWRAESKAGRQGARRIVNTTSPSGLYGNVGQANYAAAKAGIAAFTVVAARELGRYGVTVNAISPVARTRMTEHIHPDDTAAAARERGGLDERDPDNIVPLAVWLGCAEAGAVTGQVFNVHGGRVGIAEGWRAGPEELTDVQWTLERLDELVPRLVAAAVPERDMQGHPVA